LQETKIKEAECEQLKAVLEQKLEARRKQQVFNNSCDYKNGRI